MKIFYSKVLIGLNLDLGVCQINIIRIKNGVIKQNIKTNVKILDDSLPIETAKLIQFYKKKYPFTYIGVFGKTYNQGVAPITNPNKLIEYGINTKEYFAKIVDNSWCTYIKDQDCISTLMQFKELGQIDLVFSPFIPIYITSRKEGGKVSLFILQEKKNIYVAISNGKKLFYGGYFELHSDLSETSNTNFSDPMMANSQTFEDILDSISENLNAFNDLDIDLLEEEHNEEYENYEKNKVEELKDFMRATTIVGILENVIQDFYAKTTLENAFIEQIIILDTYGITQDAIKHIRDSLMIDTHIRPFSIPESITMLMLEEIKRDAL